MPGARLLLVDDNLQLLETAKDILDDAGYEVHTAASLKLALAEQQKRPFDLMIVDLNMPDGSGLDLAQQLHAAHSPTRVILMSGEVSVDLTAAPPGAIYDYLVKPVDLQKLLQVIKKAIQTR